MAVSRFPCFECGEPFDDVAERQRHYVALGHGFEQVQKDALDRARWGVMGDAAPPPESAYAVDGDQAKATMRHTVARRRLRVIPGGRR